MESHQTQPNKSTASRFKAPRNEATTLAHPEMFSVYHSFTQVQSKTESQRPNLQLNSLRQITIAVAIIWTLVQLTKDASSVVLFWNRFNRPQSVTEQHETRQLIVE